MSKALVGQRPIEEDYRPLEQRRSSRVFLAEHYLPGLDAQLVDSLTRRLERAATELRSTGIRFLGSAGVPGDESFLSLFSASSEHEVARAVARADVAVDRIVPVLWRAGHA